MTNKQITQCAERILRYLAFALTPEEKGTLSSFH